MKCRKCGYLTSDHVPSCKNCGYPASELATHRGASRTAKPKRRRALSLVNVSLALLAIAGSLFWWHFTTNNRDGAMWAANRYFLLQERAAFDDIYLTASSVFREGLSQEDHHQMMHGVGDRLGRLMRRSLAGWRTTTNVSGGSSVMLQYASRFEKGDASEILTFIWDGADWRLRGYHINSSALSPL